MNLRNTRNLILVVAGGVVLSGCVQSRLHLGRDFGVAVRQDVVAQIADPQARYPANPETDGARAALAADRYRTGKVIPPVSAAASSIGVSSSGGK